MAAPNDADSPAPAPGAGGGDGAGYAVLGAFDISCIVAGGIIGVGIFFTPSQVARSVDGPWEVLLAWALGGGIALLGALVFAELSCRVPGHGGTFRYVQAAFGAVPAFLYGWANWLVIQAGALAVVGLVLVDHVALVAGFEGEVAPLPRVVGAGAAVTVFLVVNVLGLRVGSGVQNGLTVVKLVAVFGLVLLALVAGGDVAGGTADAAAEPARGSRAEAGSADGGPLMLGLAAAILPVLFSFGGWQQGAFVAGAARRPLLDVPVGIVAGVFVVVVAYLTINLSFLDLLGHEAVAASKTVGADAARAALEPFGLGAFGQRVFAALVCVSALGILNTLLLAPPYVLHAMAKEGLFLRGCADLHARFRSPVLAVAVQGGVALALLTGLLLFGLGSEAIFFLVDGVVFVDWAFFGLCGLALLRLRMGGGEQAGFRAPGGAWIAAAFTLVALAVTVGAVVARPWPSLLGAAVCLAGVPVALAARRRAGQRPRGAGAGGSS